MHGPGHSIKLGIQEQISRPRCPSHDIILTKREQTTIVVSRILAAAFLGVFGFIVISSATSTKTNSCQVKAGLGQVPTCYGANCPGADQCHSHIFTGSSGKKYFTCYCYPHDETDFGDPGTDPDLLPCRPVVEVDPETGVATGLIRCVEVTCATVCNPDEQLPTEPATGLCLCE